MISTEEFVYSGEEAARIWAETTIRWSDYARGAFFLLGGPFIAGWVMLLLQPNTSGAICAAVGTLIGVVGVVYPFWRRNAIRARQETGVAAGQVAAQRHEFSPEGITTYYGETVSHTAWADVQLVVNGGWAWYLYPAGGTLTVLPQRVFASAEDRAQIEAWLRAQGVPIQTEHPRRGVRQR